MEDFQELIEEFLSLNQMEFCSIFKIFTLNI
jgi:hypothetical protein